MFLIDMFNKKTTMPTAESALPGRAEALPTAETHFVSGLPLKGPYPEGMRTVYLGMGCFWGAERLLWQTPGVYVTAAGYQGGITPNPTYQETVTGLTGHTEVVKVVYDPAKISLEEIFKIFFEPMTRHRACGRVTISARPTGLQSMSKRTRTWNSRSQCAIGSSKPWFRPDTAVA